MSRFPNRPCPGDYKGNHFWERVGFQDGFLIWQCSQCRCCFKEAVKFIE